MNSYSPRQDIRPRRLAVALALALTASATLVFAALQPKPHYARISQRMARRLPREHLLRQPLDETMGRRAWTNYIGDLDPNRMYFLQGDIDTFAPRRDGLSDSLRQGDVDFAYKVFRTFVERVRERRDFVEQLLDEGLDFEEQAYYEANREVAAWAAHEDEWNDLWRKRVKNEYLRRKLADKLAQKETENGNEKDGAAPVRSLRERVLDPHRQHLNVLQDTDSEWVFEKYLTAFAHAYDPHSSYMSASTVEDFNIQMKLSLVGIGAVLRPKDGAAQVMRIVPGGPADRDTRDERLREGDKIIAVGQEGEEPVDVLHWPLSRTVRKIRGEKGEKVTLVYIAASDPTGSTIRQVEITRDKVELEDQAAKLEISRLPGDNGEELAIGIINLPSFYADMQRAMLQRESARSSAADVARLLHEAQEKEVDGIILDLRNNGGGALSEALRIAGLFIGAGPVVQVGRHDEVEILESREAEESVYAGPLMVLVSRISASGSEIVAGALQDYGRAIVVGDSKTHGKGTVQNVTRLGLNPDFGNLKLTSMRYYRVSGKSTQIKGVVPDIVIPSVFDTMELGEDYRSNPVGWSTVAAVDYHRFGDLTTVIPTLRKKSEQRRAQNEAFKTYMEFLKELEQARRQTKLSLNFEERKKTVLAERERAEAREEIMSRALEIETDDEDKPDSVMDEILHVMADFIPLARTVQNESEQRARRQTAPATHWWDSLMQWLWGGR